MDFPYHLYTEDELKNRPHPSVLGARIWIYADFEQTYHTEERLFRRYSAEEKEALKRAKRRPAPIVKFLTTTTIERKCIYTNTLEWEDGNYCTRGIHGQIRVLVEWNYKITTAPNHVYFDGKEIHPQYYSIRLRKRTPQHRLFQKL